MKKILLGLCTVWCCSTTIAQNTNDPFAGNWYRLKTQFRGADECLESNAATSPDHAGAAYMDKQQNVTGQYWKFEKQPNGYYRIKSQYRGDGECLEGNQAGSPLHAGGAFMNTCSNVTGQYWKITKDGDYYRLETQFRGSAENLESGWATAPNHSGAAYMDKKQGVTGQLWKLEAVNENEGDPVIKRNTDELETLLTCEGQQYLVNAEKLIFQQVKGAWVEIGNNCTELTCNGGQVICKGTDGNLWRYSGTPHNWSPVNSPQTAQFAGATTAAGIATYKLLQGRWQAIDDKSAILEFTGNSLYGTARGTGDEFRENYILSSWCGSQGDKTKPYDRTGKEKYITCPDAEICWNIVQADANNLWVQYLAQGRILKYKKVK